MPQMAQLRLLLVEIEDNAERCSPGREERADVMESNATSTNLSATLWRRAYRFLALLVAVMMVTVLLPMCSSTCIRT